MKTKKTSQINNQQDIIWSNPYNRSPDPFLGLLGSKTLSPDLTPVDTLY